MKEKCDINNLVDVLQASSVLPKWSIIKDTLAGMALRAIKDK